MCTDSVEKSQAGKKQTPAAVCAEGSVPRLLNGSSRQGLCFIVSPPTSGIEQKGDEMTTNIERYVAVHTQQSILILTVNKNVAYTSTLLKFWDGRPSLAVVPQCAGGNLAGLG